MPNQTRRKFTLSTLVGAVASAGSFGARAADPMQVAFIYNGPVGESGWTYQHDLGRRALEQALGSKIAVRTVPNTVEGVDGERVARELSADGTRLVFACGFGHMQQVLRVAQEFPETFYSTSSAYLTAANAGGYNAKWHEGGYLAGVLAGKTTKNNAIGFVGAFAVPDVMWYLNGFILGARSVNPKVVVRAVFINNWFDPPKEREAAISLLNSGVDLMIHFTNTPAVVTAADEKGVPSISFHSDMRKFAPKQYLTGVTHNWGGYYTQVAKEVMAGTWKGQLFLGGVKEGVIKLAPFGPNIPRDVAELVGSKERDLASGRLNVFTGPIKDRNGAVRVPAGSTLTDAEVAKMTWLADGIIGAAGI